ncbi:hypothetical protein [Roseicella aquatilis]|uniref:hypothetical protein n=1 Tax=Roseicella aquatilis TaxID=2527868 RepID=UPI00104BE3B1|nr:hypothetical protein [Roseicella aquatilis]
MAGVALLSRQRALSAAADTASVEAARAVAQAGTVAWWEASAADHGMPRLAPAALPDGLPLTELSDFTVAEACAFGRDLARLPMTDAVVALGRLYTQALPSAHRAEQGIFYTPPPLAGRLLNKAERAGHDWRTGRALDPSCGGGRSLSKPPLACWPQ